MRARSLRLAAALTLAGHAACASEIVAVAGSDLRPYREVLAGAREAAGAGMIERSQGQAALSSETRVVIVVGSKASLEPYPDGIAIIYCIAPGLRLGARGPGGRYAKVDISPEPQLLLQRMRGLQPGLRRLGVLWGSNWYQNYIDALSAAGPASGLEVVAVRVASPDGVPGALRSLQDRVDALWTPMDPRALDAVSLGAIKAFAEAHSLPYYAPAESMVASAAASISGSFRDVGRTAGQAARAVLAGRLLKTEYYIERPVVVVNPAQAARMGLAFSAETLKAADRVWP